ncbi:hypothetical protein ACPWSR_05440 [Alloiococcus sp. CFN-8]|uniref:hypothetical protein n=1 Tax=Alloiococcus sp. CFN-8 TaxID=3416081 RepID=UPI003CE7FA7A
MTNNNSDSLNEVDFNSNIENKVKEMIPWGKVMNRILIGTAISTVTLNFLGLNYILSTMGIIMSVLGFRTLRRENSWFKACWIISLIRLAYFLSTMILNATIYQRTVYASSIFSVITVVNLVIIFSLFFCLWRGFKAVQKKAGLVPHAGGIVALIIWYVIICLLAFSNFNGLIIPLVLVVSYVLIIRKLFKLSKELDEAGHAVETPLVKIGDRVVVTVIFTILTIGMTCGYLFFNSYPMEWQVAEVSEDTDLVEIKEHLIDLGFSKAILEDLTDEDIKACEGALRVVVNVHDYSANDGRQLEECTGNTTYHYTVYDVEELRITSIGVELPGEREQWKIFHHFLFTDNPGFYGTESIQLWPACRERQGWGPSSDITGQVLYNLDGQVYSAPYFSMSSETYTSNSIMWGDQSSTDVFATFSMPQNGENHRGYVSYAMEEIQDGWIINSWFNYTHQKSWMQYPVMTAMEKRITNGWNNADAFLTIQDALQFFPNEDEL